MSPAIFQRLIGMHGKGNKYESIIKNNMRQDQAGLRSLDLHIIRSKSETIFVVDCDIRINTPELRQGGTRVITNMIVKDHIIAP